MSRLALPQSRLKARRRRRRIATAGIVFFLLLAIAAGAVALSWAPFARIRTITVSGAQSVATSTIIGIAQQELAGTYFYIFPRDDAFFYPKSAIADDLSRQLPVLSSVTIGLRGLNELSITVQERAPTALWCGAAAASSSPCFLLDDNGIVYTPAANFSGEVYVQYYGPVSATQPREFLTPEQFHSLTALAAAVGQAAKEPVASVSLEDNNTANIGLAGGFVLMISLGDQSADILQRFTLALTAAPFTAHPLSDFQYLDLRFGDRLYYKLKE